MRLGLAGLVLAALLMGCGQANRAPTGDTRGLVSEEAAAPAPPEIADADQFASRGGQSAQNAPATAGEAGRVDDGSGGHRVANPQQPGAAPVLYLAYAYRMALEVPADRLATVMDAHVRACQEAGPRLCQLVGSERSGDPESAMSGSVSLRAEPTWLQMFRGRIAHDADAAGGRIVSQATSTEDLTRNIVDTEASLRASRALRDRLQRLLESRPGRLSDLLDVERELARVQGEIDATESNLAVMRTRVSMSELAISYQSEAKSIRSDTFRPLGDAFANFLGIVVQGFAAIVVVIAALLPLAVVIVPIVWLLLWWRKRRGGRFFGRKPKPEPPAPT